MKGGGKYEELAEYAAQKAQAEFVVVIVMGGNQGSGFSLRGTRGEALYSVPTVLRHMADEIEKDLQGGKA